MIALSLQSGSNGNCIYVEANGVNLLFDAGICGSDAEHRLAAIGRDIREVDALIISHDHADHIRYAETNNDPSVAMRTHIETVGSNLLFHIASRYQATSDIACVSFIVKSQ
jgi:metal-dependent hydrolase (beta-lactamase superfamily II)